MSTLKVDAIRHNSASSDAITTHSDGTASAKLIDVGGGPLSHRNYFINGNTIIWQRGTSNPNVGAYGCDRWWFANGATRVDRSTTVPDGFPYSMKVTSNGNTTSIGQPIELIATGRSQFEPNASYTLSFYARTDSGTNSISSTVYYRNSKYSGTNQVNWGPSVTQNMGTMTTTFQRFSKTFTAPSAANSNNQVLAIEFNNTATYYITGMQFERGDTMTAYEHRSTSEELARCYRYFVKFAGGSDAYCFPAKGQGSSSCDIGVPLPTALRASPSITVSNHRYFSGHSGGFSSSSNTPSVIHYESNIHSPMISLNAGGHSSSNNYTGTFTPQSSSFIIDAEL